MTARTTPALPSGYRFATLAPDDWRQVLDLDAWSFPTSTTVEELLTLPSPLTWERTVGVFADVDDPEVPPVDGAVPTRADLVAVHSSYPFGSFPVPGATLPVAGLTWVCVHPGHRRRRLLTTMIGRHFADCRERGESVSALFAAEAAIYGRFGYGSAAHEMQYTIPRGAKLRDVPGAERHTVRIEHASRERHGELVAGLHIRAGANPTGHGAPVGTDGVHLNRPGWATRETPELQAAYWADPAFQRKDTESRRILIVELDGEPRGYATVNRQFNWEPTGPRGAVNIAEVVALDAAAARALWGVLTDLDLTTEVLPRFLATDDAIGHLLVDPRAAAPRSSDNLWVRVLDAGAALAGRRYAADLDVVLHLSDAQVPENTGRWHLRASAHQPAFCERTDAAPDLSLDIRELGTAYLGGVTLASLALAGLVTEHRSGALAAASTAFAWPVAPLSSWIF